MSPAQIEELRDAVGAFRRENSTSGASNMRNLLSGCPYVKSFAVSGIAFEIASEILDVPALPVRAILFDKTPAANWYVTWHQDLSIPVKERHDIAGYGPWSTKEGVLHVQPPASSVSQSPAHRRVLHIEYAGVQLPAGLAWAEA
ncbi:MAG: hypothetical protein SFV17_00300 [Candidatus Obscuribacter sp.]|nr:hypothetical protein [Candidatus Melainabacteria bacterium]MDX1985103.1 hypothetical protein [Candidatus Obscuribacter sp.]